jgi:small-conductance mechanosensitive channel
MEEMALELKQAQEKIATQAQLLAGKDGHIRNLDSERRALEAEKRQKQVSGARTSSQVDQEEIDREREKLAEEAWR